MQCECDDSENCLQRLKTVPFSTRTFENKHAIIAAGRPTPSLKIVQQKKNCNRYFSDKFYENYNWFAGCKHINKLFCWACLLFSKEKNVWTNVGYADLNNLTNAAKKHDQSENHIKSALSLCNFGQNRIEMSLSRQFKEEIERHNSKVDRNRNLMRRLIDITCFLGKQELPFRGHTENTESSNRGNFIECIQLLANYDGILEDHLHASNENEKRNVFSGFSNRIQNDLISAIAFVLKEKMRHELHQTDFVAIMIDETPDISGKEQLCVIFRYFTESNEVVDRFMGFIDVSPDRTAEALTKIITDILNDYKCTDKLVAQTYDGAAVLSSSKNGVQQKVREICPDAIYVWCNAHILNLVLSKSCERIVETKHFFGSIKNLGAFFHTSTKRSDFYNRFCSKKLPRVVQTRWAYNSRTVNVIFSELTNLKDLFNDMLENQSNWDGETLAAARMYLFTLEDFEFNYFLEIFNVIFAQTDVLYSIIQCKLSDIGYCIKKIENFKAFLENLFTEFEKIYAKCANTYGEPKRKRNMSDVKTHYRRIFREIVDNIKSEIDDRYREIRLLQFFHLLDPDCFESFKNKFPEEVFKELKIKYGLKFDFERLKNELNCLYSSLEFKGMNVYEVIRFCHEKKMCEVFPQIIKLAKLIVTIPASSASAERSFSGLKRIHTYLRNTQGQDRLSSLSIISLEKELLLDLKRNLTFYDDVIKAFLMKNRRIELIYKK
ncbi:unnamed protein product [Psylliodes chrysocephalus]|uniref:Zinc finger MYM-type protein 1-like n=1 Tax=Psylliodes chrysocephalus TaxID=3402493 RepID=A0A9P0CG52_9CUCU|nr:unnamed protein product [Psylliodes chrysocephala]